MKIEFQSIQDVEIHDSFSPFVPSELPKISYKHASLDFVKSRTTPYVQHILSKMPFTHLRKRILVDIKVHHLKKGWYPAIPGWHIDGVQNITHAAQKTRNIYHLFLSGETSITQFLSKRVQRDVDEHTPPDYDALLQGIGGVSIPKNTICSYSIAPHRAIAAKKQEFRLLIRAVETDFIRPRNTSFQVYYQKE